MVFALCLGTLYTLFTHALFRNHLFKGSATFYSLCGRYWYEILPLKLDIDASRYGVGVVNVRILRVDEGNFVDFSISMVKLMLSLLPYLVKGSSTYLKQIEGRALPVMTHFSSKKHMKVFANIRPAGEPGAAPSVCS